MNVIFVDRNTFRLAGTMALSSEFRADMVQQIVLNDEDLMNCWSYESITHVIYAVQEINSLSKRIIHDIKLKNRHVKILLLAEIKDNIFPPIFFGSGADGIISIDSDILQFKFALYEFFDTGAYIPSGLVSTKYKFNHNQLRNVRLTIEKILSPREYIVMQYIISGKSLCLIARIMDLNISTVHTFKRRLYKKLSVSSLKGLYRIVNSAECNGALVDCIKN